MRRPRLVWGVWTDPELDDAEPEHDGETDLLDRDERDETP